MAPGDSNTEAQRYYSITERSYLALTDARQPLMNLGLWQDLRGAAAIPQAQTRLVEALIEAAMGHLPWLSTQAGGVFEIGPGWGGSRAIIHRLLPHLNYIGLNCSSSQMQHARDLNADIPNTLYEEGFVEALTARRIPAATRLVVGVESLLHCKNRQQFIKTCADARVPAVALAEICWEDPAAVHASPLFDPALKFVAATRDYEQGFAAAGYKLRMLEVGAKVFMPWVEALRSWCIERPDVGARRVYRDLVASYETLAALYEQNRVSYRLLVATLEGA